MQTTLWSIWDCVGMLDTATHSTKNTSESLYLPAMLGRSDLVLHFAQRETRWSGTNSQALHTTLKPPTEAL